MDDVQVFKAAFKSSGIDIERLMARARQDDVKKRLIELTNDTVARGAFGSPTFFAGNEMFFGKDQLRDVEEEIVAQKGQWRRPAERPKLPPVSEEQKTAGRTSCRVHSKVSA